MDKDRLDRWLGTVGHIAVVIGLIVVAIELRQSASVANGELSSQFMSNWQELDRSRQDPSFAAVYSKSIQHPQDLTLDEAVRLDGYYWVVMDQLELARMLVELDLFDGSYEQILRESVRVIFTTAYSQAWWQVHSASADPRTVAIVNDELRLIPPDTEQVRLESILSQFRP